MSDNRVYFAHHLSNVPVPRARWEWDGPDYSWITAEIACKWSDPIIGVTWELSTSLANRIDRWAEAGRPLWGDHPLPVVAAFFAVCLAGFMGAVVCT